MPLIRIVYYSEPNRASGINMKSLNDSCVRNNARDSIGGFLHYNGFYFLQVLEGEQAKVITCYERIVKDPRHNNLVLIGAEHVEKPIYPEWSIGLDSGINFPTKEVFLANFAASTVDTSILQAVL
jgi:Sensors of blue-light using FAD